MDSLVSKVLYAVSLAPGEVREAVFVPPTPGKYVLEVSGAPALVGVYQGMKAVGFSGVLRVDPGQKRGVRTLASVPHLVTITGAGGMAGTTSLVFRPWSFWDYFRS